MFEIGQKLWCCTEALWTQAGPKQVVSCEYVCPVVCSEGGCVGYAVRIKDNTITVLKSNQLFKTRGQAVNRLLQSLGDRKNHLQKRISISQFNLKIIEDTIRELEND